MALLFLITFSITFLQEACRGSNCDHATLQGDVGCGCDRSRSDQALSVCQTFGFLLHRVAVSHTGTVKLIPKFFGCFMQLLMEVLDFTVLYVSSWHHGRQTFDRVYSRTSSADVSS